MGQAIIEVADGFWNIRGSFKVARFIDVGTHMSLVRRSNGNFVLLDACGLGDETAARIDALTEGGSRIEAILNLHPFHTVYVPDAHARYPEAVLYGTARHRVQAPDLPWAELGTESPKLHQQFSEDLDFSVPDGVSLISDNENVHFSSVLAFHTASRTIHVDDTFNYVGKSGLLGMTPLADSVSFHPTLAKALEKESGAAQAFRQWANTLIEHWRRADNLCAAHMGVLLKRDNDGAALTERMKRALDKVEPVLQKHEQRYG